VYSLFGRSGVKFYAVLHAKQCVAWLMNHKFLLNAHKDLIKLSATVAAQIAESKSGVILAFTAISFYVNI
jgi:hypothetical protein